MHNPPANFAMCAEGVYRGGFPSKRNCAFLRRVGLRSIVYLVPEDPPEYYLEFMRQNDIALLRCGMVGNKEPFVEIPPDAVAAAVVKVRDPANHPVYIHCDKGKHRTGCIVGGMRKAQHWSLAAILEEYRRFAGEKVRTLDQQFIELFSVDDAR